MANKLINYVYAAVLVGAVTLVKHFVPGLGDENPTLMYHLVVVVAAIFLGTGPAVFALLVSGGLVDYFFLHPHQWLFPGGNTSLAIFFIDGGIMIWLVGRLRSAERQLGASNQELRRANDRITKLLEHTLDAFPEPKRPHGSD